MVIAILAIGVGLVMLIRPQLFHPAPKRMRQERDGEMLKTNFLNLWVGGGLILLIGVGYLIGQFI